jgi:hypothetical protein
VPDRSCGHQIQLRNVVRVADMTDHVDFHAQASVDGGDEGTLRPT